MYMAQYELKKLLSTPYRLLELVKVHKGKSPQNGTERVSVTSAKTFFFP